MILAVFLAQYMNVSVHISFPGTCEAAFRFYQKCLGGNLSTMLPWGDSPASHMVPAHWHAKICHATLDLGATSFSGVDTPPGTAQAASGFQLLFEADSIEQATQTFALLAEHGSIQVPFGKTFWAESYGALTDQFGISWEVQYSV